MDRVSKNMEKSIHSTGTSLAEKGRHLLAAGTSGRYFFLELSHRIRGGLAVAYGGRETCAPEYLVERTTYPYFTLEYICEGEGELRFGPGPAITLRPGTCFAHGPGVALRMSAAGRPMLKYFLSLTGRDARAALSSPVRLVGRAVHVATHRELQEVFETLLRETRDHTRWVSPLCLNLFERLRLKMAEVSEAGVRTGNSGLARDRFLHCKSLIDAEAARLRSVHELTQRTQLRRGALFALFREHLGTSPYQYLLRQKMNLAAHRLIASGDRVKEVAASVGFADPLHFTRVFTQVHGLSPRAWRQSHGPVVEPDPPGS